MPRGYIPVLLCLTVLLGATVFCFAHSAPSAPYYVSLSFSEESPSDFFRVGVRYWTGLIRQNGPEFATTEIIQMKNRPEEFSPKLYHAVAHAFGEALFRTGGLKNIHLCEHVITWGCYHQILASVVSASSSIETSLLPLFAYCDQMTDSSELLTCRHALGHGILGYYGYTLPDLKKALESCRAADPDLEKAGCFSGAIMEYNLRGLTKADADYTFRPLTTQNFFTPCDELDEQYIPICVRELPEWWEGFFNQSSDLEQLFVWLGAKCRSLSVDFPLLSCFEGIGIRAHSVDKQNPEELCSFSAQSQEELSACVRSARSFPIRI